MPRHSQLCALAVLALLAGIRPLAAAEPASVKVTLWDKQDGTMGITLSQDKVKAGAVEFEVTNTSSAQLHEFLIAPWRRDIKALPYDAKATQVAEDKVPGLQGVEDMKPSLQTTLRLVLRPGDYVVFCNQPTHYKMGMERRFTVTP